LLLPVNSSVAALSALSGQKKGKGNTWSPINPTNIKALPGPIEPLGSRDAHAQSQLCMIYMKKSNKNVD